MIFPELMLSFSLFIITIITVIKQEAGNVRHNLGLRWEGLQTQLEGSVNGISHKRGPPQVCFGGLNPRRARLLTPPCWVGTPRLDGVEGSFSLH